MESHCVCFKENQFRFQFSLRDSTLNGFTEHTKCVDVNKVSDHMKNLCKSVEVRTVLLEAGKRAYPGRNPDTVIFHRVHSAIEEVSSLHDPVTKHFILADSEEQECTRTVVFAVLLPAMSSLELAIGHGRPKCGTFLTCVEARKGGLSTTTISDSGTTRCQYIMATSLLAM